MTKPIYLDYAATTPIDPRVAEAMQAYLTPEGVFGNAASNTHVYGYEAKMAVETAREQVAQLIKADIREMVWTSGATEADNAAIKGVAWAYQAKGKHIITQKTEHKAVLDTCHYLASIGFEVDYCPIDQQGVVDLEALSQLIRPDTILVSIMHVNNETGVMQDIAAIGALCRQHKVLFHVDAAQSLGKVAIDVKAMQVDLMSFSAHKLYGPKGVGVLYVRRKPKIRLVPLIHGGGHEHGYRSGTLATHQIVGMGMAAALANEHLADEMQQIHQLKMLLWQGIAECHDVVLNGHLEQSVPGILNVSFVGVDGEALIMALHQLAISSGSACTSATVEPSHVLRAMGVSDALAHSAIRFSIGRFTTQQEIETAVEQIQHHVKRLRQLASFG